MSPPIRDQPGAASRGLRIQGGSRHHRSPFHNFGTESDEAHKNTGTIEVRWQKHSTAETLTARFYPLPTGQHTATCRCLSGDVCRRQQERVVKCAFHQCTVKVTSRYLANNSLVVSVVWVNETAEAVTTRVIRRWPGNSPLGFRPDPLLRDRVDSAPPTRRWCTHAWDRLLKTHRNPLGVQVTAPSVSGANCASRI